MQKICCFAIFVCFIFSSCSNNSTGNNAQSEKEESALQQKKEYHEGKDYMVYERVRILDKTGFTEPQEAYSILLPKGWRQQSEIIWETQSACTGTYRKLKATSPDGKYSLEMFPDIVYMWNTNEELMQFNRQNPTSSAFCAHHEPVKAADYLQMFAKTELENASVTKVEENEHVIKEMQQQNQSTMQELRQYGAGEMRFDQSAINAVVKFADGSEGFVVLGANILETTVANYYTGGADKMYTTQIFKRIVFKYPQGQGEQAAQQFSAIMGSFRTNPAWNDAVNNYWKQARQQKHVAHVGKIKMMDEQTRRIGEQTIKNGQQRLQTMDNQLRSWEQSQNSQDRMHTSFIKTIREVENYQDETGKYEMTSAYTNAWSRGDGNSFIMSNNPNFDPAAVFQDQNWKEMKKVD